MFLDGNYIWWCVCLFGFQYPEWGRCCVGRVASGSGSAQPHWFVCWHSTEKASDVLSSSPAPGSRAAPKVSDSFFRVQSGSLCSDWIKFGEKASHQPGGVWCQGRKFEDEHLRALCEWLRWLQPGPAPMKGQQWKAVTIVKGSERGWAFESLSEVKKQGERISGQISKEGAHLRCVWEDVQGCRSPWEKWMDVSMDVHAHTNGPISVYMLFNSSLERALRAFKGTQGGQRSGKMKSEGTNAKQHTYQWQKTQSTPTVPYIVNQLRLLLKTTSQQSARQRTLTSRKQNTTFCCANSRLDKK